MSMKMLAVIEVKRNELRTVDVDWRNEILTIGEHRITYEFLLGALMDPTITEDLKRLTDISIHDLVWLIKQTTGFDEKRLSDGPVFLHGRWVLWRGDIYENETKH